MTLDEKIALSDRLNKAIDSLDADYAKSQANAEKFYTLYFDSREWAKIYHQRLMLLLQAKHDLWSDDKEEF